MKELHQYDSWLKKMEMYIPYMYPEYGDALNNNVRIVQYVHVRKVIKLLCLWHMPLYIRMEGKGSTDRK